MLFNYQLLISNYKNIAQIKHKVRNTLSEQLKITNNRHKSN